MPSRKPRVWDKDPDAVLDYVWDWSAWLAPEELITAHSATASDGIAVDSSSHGDGTGAVTVWLSGGDAGTTYRVTVRVTTNQGRTDDRTAHVQVIER